MALSVNDLHAQELARSTTLPAWCYASEDGAALDRRSVFARTWQLVARADLLAEPGDHVVAELAGLPLLLVRGADGELRALHNVCRHRAGPLATCNGSGARRLRCHYHGWTYDLTGQLLSAPEMSTATAFDVDSVHVPQARVAAWNGLVFACLDEAAPELAHVMSGIDTRMGAGRLDGYRFHQHVAYDIDCNWKVYVDNYLEGYHVPHIHPELNAMLDYRSYIIDTARWYSLQHSPLESGDALYGSGEALYYLIWPNTMLNILPDRLQTNRVLPLGAQRCRVEFDYYYPDDIDDAEMAERHQRDHAFSDLVQQQDVDMCERVQRGLASGSYQSGRLNPLRENGVHHFQELLREAYRHDRDQS